jgi:Protein of unknown function (DUF1203)
MSTTKSTFRIEAIASVELDRLRPGGQDDFGNPIDLTIDEGGGSPLRCCLRPAEPGARVGLIAYRPFTRPGPYAEVGPVFIHADRCPGYDTPDEYPPGFRNWPTMIFRPYHFNGRMAYPALAMVDGGQAEQVIATMFADPTIELIHSRNLYAGCFMFAIHRSTVTV